VLGVEPDPSVDGFARILFTPTLGSLGKVSGTVPTPHGPVTVRLWRDRHGTVKSKLTSPVPVKS